MIAINVNRADLDAALSATNKLFDDNVCWKREPESLNHSKNRFRFTLRVVSSKGAGHRLSAPNPWSKQRRMPSACWHVHGEFFDALLDVNRQAIIKTELVGKREISIDGGNWQDAQVGSMAYPAYLSDLCDCD